MVFIEARERKQLYLFKLCGENNILKKTLLGYYDTGAGEQAANKFVKINTDAVSFVAASAAQDSYIVSMNCLSLVT